MIIFSLAAIFLFFLTDENTANKRFLLSFGIKVAEKPCLVEEIVIPYEFDDYYNSYNSLQIESGLTLSPHKGKTGIRYTYKVLNFEKNVSSTTFNNVPDQYTIVITKDNYIPYIIKKDCHLTGGTIDIHKVIAGCTRTKIGGMPNFADNIMQTNNTTTSIPEIDAPANPPSVWQVKITPTGSLEVLNGGIVIINYLSMEDGGELYIH
jgi:hypothetical protein